MPKAAVATAEDPIVQEYHRTLRAVDAQSMRELDKLNNDELRKRVQAKVRGGAVPSKKPPPVVDADDTDERESVK